MFNMIASLSSLSILTVQSFFVLFCVRLLFFKKKIALFFFHFLLFLGLFVSAIGGGSVQNDDYESLRKFKTLEQNPNFTPTKEDLNAIHWKGFETSRELQDYIESRNPFIDKAEAVSVGWFFVLCADVAIVFMGIFGKSLSWLQQRMVFLRKKNHNTSVI